MADVDAQLQRGCCHQGLELAALEFLLGVEALLASQAAVMRGHLVLPQPLGQCACEPLGQPARVDEHEGGAVLLDQAGEPLVDLSPDLARHHRFQRRFRHFDGQIAPAHVAGVDDDAGRGACATRISVVFEQILRRAAAEPHQKTRHLLDRPLGRRQADAGEAIPGDVLQALERQREVRSALVGRERMNLVDDDRARAGQRLAPGLAGQKNVERFWRGHQDVRGLAPHPVTVGLRRVPGAHQRTDLDLGEPETGELLTDAGQRLLKVLVDVV